MFGNGSKDEDNRHEADHGTHYSRLRRANEVRQHEWDPGNHTRNLFWRVNELAGEVGELCNVLKKLHRERCGVPGSRATKDDLAEEAADVLICIDLLAIDYGVDAQNIQSLAAVLLKHDGRDETLVQRGTTLARCLGRVCDTLGGKDDGPDGNVAQMASRLGALQANILLLARAERIDMSMAVENKFNATTRKMGLTTFLRYSEP